MEKILFRLRPWFDILRLVVEAPSDNRTHLDAAVNWLCHAQDATLDDGVAHSYLVRSKRWANSYPETTGYIIPTFYSYASLTGRRDIRERALKMAEWECAIQLPCGGVVAGAIGDCDKPTIFNTGQVIFGWVRAFQEEGLEEFRNAAIKAADWLISVQDGDGCWRHYGSPLTGKQVNTYNTRTAWSLAKVSALTGDNRYLDAAVRNVEWALTVQLDNGWLKRNCLQDNSQPFVHTIAYAMRGIMEIGVLAGREDFILAARKIGDAMLANLPANGFLPGRFDEGWRATVKWSCLTGCAQMGINWGRLYQLTGEERYRAATRRINFFVKKTQRFTGDISEKGGIKGSHPIDGGYHPWQYPNWAAKFFADALMIEESILKKDDLNWEFTNDG